MSAPTRIPLPSPAIPPAVRPFDKAGVQRAIIAAALAAVAVGFVSAVQELRAVRADLADAQERLAVLEAARAPAGGYPSVDAALGEHARRVQAEVTP